MYILLMYISPISSPLIRSHCPFEGLFLLSTLCFFLWLWKISVRYVHIMEVLIVLVLPWSCYYLVWYWNKKTSHVSVIMPICYIIRYSLYLNSTVNWFYASNVMFISFEWKLSNAEMFHQWLYLHAWPIDESNIAKLLISKTATKKFIY